jgi:predicted secreted hydrolase
VDNNSSYDWRFYLFNGSFFLLAGSLLSLGSLVADGFDNARVYACQIALPGYAYHFPRDHGSHDEFHTEWWYYTGHLRTHDGRQFGYELTFFRRSIDNESARINPSQWAIRHLYLAHFALSDHTHRTFRYAEKISRAGLGKAGADADRLHVWIDRWTAESPPLQPSHHRLEASSHEFSIQVDLDSQKLPIIHGQDGVSRKGKDPHQTSHYYSMTRLATAGILMVDGERMPVTGMSWMDHEFGSGVLGDDQIGWDWFSVQLDNQIEVMLYLLRRRDGTVDPVSSGTLILPDGRTQYLFLADFQVQALDHWDSPSSGAHYPSRWSISIPKIDLTLYVNVRQENQELITTKSTQVTYWEGAVSISGTLKKHPVSGQGYVELTGYAEPFSSR